uniref:Uncharacterized protein n=1 Tax=Fagus sylvatica TaxID=28930 RepID=A0A2N9FAX7_FAGSY
MRAELSTDSLEIAISTVAVCSGFVEDFWWVCTGCGGAAWRGLAVGRGVAGGFVRWLSVVVGVLVDSGGEGWL